jgi:large exoprotein involved in heme utilization and adhesion
VVVQRSDIVANARAGVGGNITIAANAFLVSGGTIFETPTPGLFRSIDSTFDTSSEFGVEGEFDVRAPDAALAGQLVSLPARFHEEEDLVTNQCDVRQEPVGSLIQRGRDRLPAAPGDDLRIFHDGER